MHIIVDKKYKEEKHKVYREDKTLRRSDGHQENDCERLFSIKKTDEQVLVKRKTEEAYQRGFHQAFAFLKYALEDKGIDTIDISMLQKAEDIAYEMRHKKRKLKYCYKAQSYVDYGHVFYIKCKRLLQKLC